MPLAVAYMFVSPQNFYDEILKPTVMEVEPLVGVKS